MSHAILDALRRISPGAEPGPDGLPRSGPRSIDEAAHVLGAATEQGWRVRLEGAGSWAPPDAPADLALSTRHLAAITRIAPDDLVLTAQAGVSRHRLESAVAARRTRLALDPPGGPERTLGSVLATATTGPRRQADGLVRDHVLGVTLVTGDGRTLRPGGSVVKNVAGFDLAKLAVGGFGAFGLIAEAHLRLRAAPAATVTLTAAGRFEPLFDAALTLAREQAELAALELLSPTVTGTAGWTLLVEAAGTEAAVRPAADRVAATGPAWRRLDPETAAGLTAAVSRAAVAGPVTLRFGVLPDAIPGLLELLPGPMAGARLTAGPGRGGARWTGDLTALEISDLRARLAVREIPVTVERAPWPVRVAAGHFGACREGVGRLSERLRATFDPARTLVVPLLGGSA